jgi:hypothetical protein
MAQPPYTFAVLTALQSSWLRVLTRVQAVHRRERKVEFREDYFDTMPGAEIDKTDRPATREEPGHWFSGCGRGTESSYTETPFCGASTDRGYLFRP